MKSLLLVVSIASAACQGGVGSEAPAAGSGATATAAPAGTPATTATYAGDIERLCNVMALSGADKQGPGDRMLTTANWLSENLQTPESKRFMLQTNQLDREARVAALEAEATRVGLAGCPLAALWR